MARDIIHRTEEDSIDDNENCACANCGKNELGVTAHGPIGTMGNHTHNFGEFMFSYRYMNMFMKWTLTGMLHWPMRWQK